MSPHGFKCAQECIFILAVIPMSSQFNCVYLVFPMEENWETETSDEQFDAILQEPPVRLDENMNQMSSNYHLQRTASSDSAQYSDLTLSSPSHAVHSPSSYNETGKYSFCRGAENSSSWIYFKKFAVKDDVNGNLDKSEWEMNRVKCNHCTTVWKWHALSKLYKSATGTGNLNSHAIVCPGIARFKVQQAIQEAERIRLLRLMDSLATSTINDVSVNEVNISDTSIGKKRPFSGHAVQTVLLQGQFGQIISKNIQRTPDRDRTAIDILFVRGGLPFAFIASTAWLEFMNYICPDLTDIKSSTTLSRDISNVLFPTYERFIKALLHDEMQHGTLFNLGTDIWVCGRQHRGYFVITIRYVDKYSKPIRLILHFGDIPVPHTGEQIKKSIVAIINERWGIINAVQSIVLDNASTINFGENPEEWKSLFLSTYDNFYSGVKFENGKIITSSLHYLTGKPKKTGTNYSSYESTNKSDSSGKRMEVDAYLGSRFLNEDDNDEDDDNNCSSEAQLYLAEKRLSMKDHQDLDVLKYWRNKASQYPRLALMARNSLGMEATSVQSESSFSYANNLITDDRNKLSVKVVESLVLSDSWITAAERYQWSGLRSDISWKPIDKEAALELLQIQEIERARNDAVEKEKELEKSLANLKDRDM